MMMRMMMRNGQKKRKVSTYIPNLTNTGADKAHCIARLDGSLLGLLHDHLDAVVIWKGV